MGKGPLAGMTRGSVRQWWEPRAHHCLGLHFWCKEYPGEPPSAKWEKRFTVPRAPPPAPPAPPAPTRRPRGERQPNESQRNSTSMAQVPVWTWVMQPFICESKGPPRTEERPKPTLDCDSKTTGHLTLPMLSVSQLSRPAWPRTNAAGCDETRPASEVSGAVGKLSSPSCFPNCLVIPRPGTGRPRTLIDHLLQFLSYSRLPASNPKPSIKRWTWKLRFSISDLEGGLWLLTPLVSLAKNGERSAGIFPLHG